MNIKIKYIIFCLLILFFTSAATAGDYLSLLANPKVRVKLIGNKGRRLMAGECGNPNIPTLNVVAGGGIVTILQINYVSGGTATNLHSNLPLAQLPGVSEASNNCTQISAANSSCQIGFAGSIGSTGQAIVTINGMNANAAQFCLVVLN